MKNLLRGLAVGLPLLMLLGEALSEEERSEMAERMHQIWIDAKKVSALRAETGVNRQLKTVEIGGCFPALFLLKS